VPEEERITLECPYCRGEIYRPLGWFRQPYFTCPACGGGLAADQFAVLVAELEEAFEASVAEMVHGKPGCGCGCRSREE
jgi:hypothetical protein